MLSSRKDFEELDGTLSFLVEKQGDLERLLGALQGEIRREFSEELALAKNEIQGHSGAQIERLLKGLSKTFQQIVDKLEGQHAEIERELEILKAQNFEQAAAQNKMVAALNELRATAGQLGEQIEAHHGEWREATDYALRDETPSALREWCDHIADELRGFGDCQGIVRQFAGRLLKTLTVLRALLERTGASAQGFDGQLEELQRALFAPDLGMDWADLTPANSTSVQRRQLLVLENAVREFRAFVREELRRETGIAALEIVPGETRFDARFHESSEFLEVPTSDPARHNLIVSIERAGYIQTAPDGALKLLQSARVRRWVLSAPAVTPHNAPQLDANADNANANVAPVETEAAVAASDENTARVRGQL